MLSYFKINSERDLEWKEDLDDGVFIVIVTTVVHDFGIGTYLLCNRAS